MAPLAFAAKKDNAQTWEDHLDRRAAPGVMLLSARKQLLYMNSTAGEIAQELSRDSGDDLTAIPSEIVAFCDDLLPHLPAHGSSEERRRMEMRRVAAAGSPGVLLRGFGVPDPTGQQQPNILILMERMSQRRAPNWKFVQGRYQLSDREADVLRVVAKGATNRVIARTLEISENTVKEHVRHLMVKTGTPTRNALMALLLSHS